MNQPKLLARRDFNGHLRILNGAFEEHLEAASSIFYRRHLHSYENENGWPEEDIKMLKKLRARAKLSIEEFGKSYAQTHVLLRKFIPEGVQGGNKAMKEVLNAVVGKADEEAVDDSVGYLEFEEDRVPTATEQDSKNLQEGVRQVAADQDVEMIEEELPQADPLPVDEEMIDLSDVYKELADRSAVLLPKKDVQLQVATNPLFAYFKNDPLSYAADDAFERVANKFVERLNDFAKGERKLKDNKVVVRREHWRKKNCNGGTLRFCLFGSVLSKLALKTSSDVDVMLKGRNVDYGQINFKQVAEDVRYFTNCRYIYRHGKMESSLLIFENCLKLDARSYSVDITDNTGGLTPNLFLRSVTTSFVQIRRYLLAVKAFVAKFEIVGAKKSYPSNIGYIWLAFVHLHLHKDYGLPTLGELITYMPTDGTRLSRDRITGGLEKFAEDRSDLCGRAFVSFAHWMSTFNFALYAIDTANALTPNFHSTCRERDYKTNQKVAIIDPFDLTNQARATAKNSVIADIQSAFKAVRLQCQKVNEMREAGESCPSYSL